MRFKLFVIWLFGILILFVSYVCAEERPGIPALLSNAEYVSLRQQDEKHRVRIDSMQVRISELRRGLKNNPGAQETYGGQILLLESEMLSEQAFRNRIAARINAIEQAWLAEHPDYVPAAADDCLIERVPEARQHRDLVSNAYFRENLPVRDFEALLQAQRMETEAVECVGRLLANYGRQMELKEMYDTVRTEQRAVELYECYRTAVREGRMLQDTLASLWGYVYDNKTYAYDYVLDKLNCCQQQAEQEKAVDAVRRRLAELQAESLFGGLPDYYIRKQQLVDYERRIAGLLGLTLAADSLQRVAGTLRTIEYRFPKLRVSERYFLNYEPIEFSATGRYSAKKPVPECPVYENGVIYRILLGEFRYKQDPSIFRNTVPLYVQKSEAGRYRYFAGGFATKSEAVVAQESLRKRGFRAPALVVWYDGRYTNLTENPEAEIAAFRVEITSEHNLSDAVRQAIAATAPECDLSRAGQDTFIVGRFDNKAIADETAAAIRSADPRLTVKVREIAE